MTTLNTIIEEEKTAFEEMERNHGWIPEHKKRIKDFLTTAMQRAYEAGRAEERRKTEIRYDSAVYEVYGSEGAIKVRETLDTILSKITHKSE